MTTNGYTHLTKDDLGWIEIYYEQGLKPYKIAEKIGRSNQRVGHQMPLLVGGEKNRVCSMSTICIRFKDSSLFDVTTLPMKG